MTRNAIGVVLLSLLVAGCYDAPKDAKHPMPLGDQGTYKVGIISLGRFAIPVQCDSSEYQKVDTIFVARTRHVKERPWVMARMGSPAYQEIETRSGDRLKLAWMDLLTHNWDIAPGNIYRLEYGHRDVYCTANDVWNVLQVQRLVPVGRKALR